MNVIDITRIPDKDAADVISNIAKAIEDRFDFLEVNVGYKLGDEPYSLVKEPDPLVVYLRRKDIIFATQEFIHIKDGRIRFPNSSRMHGLPVREIYAVMHTLYPMRLTCDECSGRTTSDYGEGSEPPHYVGEQETCRTCRGSGMYAPYRKYSVVVQITVYEKGAEVGGENVTYSSDIEENCIDDAIATAKRRLGISGRI
jgi:hypothetical protein